MQETMKRLNIGIDSFDACNMFMVNEAEAAAMYALSSEFRAFKVCSAHIHETTFFKTLTVASGEMSS